MRGIIYLTLLVISFTLECCNSNTDPNAEKSDCPERQVFFSNIETITSFYENQTDTSFASSLRSDSLEHELTKSLDYLHGITGLESHVNLGYVCEYTSRVDFENDIQQYTEWYENHCTKE
jgi:hypothetical protein